MTPLFSRPRQQLRNLAEGPTRTACGSRWLPDDFDAWFEKEAKANVAKEDQFRLLLKTKRAKSSLSKPFVSPRAISHTNETASIRTITHKKSSPRSKAINTSFNKTCQLTVMVSLLDVTLIFVVLISS